MNAMVSSIFICLMVLVAWAYRLHATREEIRDANGDLYLTRYFIWKPRNKKFGRIYLHHIIRSDHDRALHDHPWGFVSLILWGGYVEVADTWQPLPKKVRDWWTHNGWVFRGNGEVEQRFRPGSLLRRPASWRHRLVLQPGHTAWTLVKTTSKQRDWGFWPNGKFCWWRHYDFALGICEEDLDNSLRPVVNERQINAR